MSWWAAPLSLMENHVVKKPYSEIEKALLIDNAKGPNRLSSLQLQWYFFYKLNSFRTVSAITRKTQKLMKELNVPPSPSAAQEDEGDDFQGAVSDCGDEDNVHHQQDCPICMQLPSQDSIALPCGHSFCLPCLQGWLAKHHDTCPLCRTQVHPDIKMVLLHGISMTFTFDLDIVWPRLT